MIYFLYLKSKNQVPSSWLLIIVTTSQAPHSKMTGWCKRVGSSFFENVGNLGSRIMSLFSAATVFCRAPLLTWNKLLLLVKWKLWLRETEVTFVFLIVLVSKFFSFFFFYSCFFVSFYFVIIEKQHQIFKLSSRITSLLRINLKSH